MERREWHTERKRRVALKKQHLGQRTTAKGEKSNEAVAAQPSSVKGAEESRSTAVKGKAEVKVNAEV